MSAMRKRIQGGLRHPFRFPEWMEYGLTAAGIMQSAIGWVWLNDVRNRESLKFLFIPMPAEIWVSLGGILAAAHLYGLWSQNYSIRQKAALGSLAFWFHFFLAVLASALWNGDGFPTMASATFVAFYSAFGVYVRLRMQWTT